MNTTSKPRNTVGAPAPTKPINNSDAPDGGKPRARIGAGDAPSMVNVAGLEKKIIVGNGKGEDTVRVNIPKAFRLMDDHHHVHVYDKLGEQDMPVSHANAPYAKDNGVTILEE